MRQNPSAELRHYSGCLGPICFSCIGFYPDFFAVGDSEPDENFSTSVTFNALNSPNVWDHHLFHGPDLPLHARSRRN